MTNLNEMTLSALVELYNQHAPKPVKKFRDKATAVARVQAVLPAARKRGRPARHADDAMIKVMVDLNPKRPGSMSFEWFKLYESGMTVAEALARGVKREWMRWDEKYGYIEIS